jgi:hypothetical protein
MARFRQKKSRNWARGILATFWILLAGVSGLYLFSTFADPSLGGQLVKITPASGEMTSAVSGPRDQELADIKSSLRELTQQVAALSARLDPEKKSATSSSEDADSETASEPATPPASASTTPPEVAAASPSSPATASPEPAKPEEKPAEAPKSAEAPAPAPEPKPIEQAAVEPQQPPAAEPEPKPYEPPAVAVSPLEPPAEEEEAPSADMSPPSPSEAATEEAAEPDEMPATAPASSPSTPEPPPPATESAALDPIALPPAANDGSTRYGIEIGAVSKQDALRPLWREFLTNHAALVAGLQPRRVLAPDKKWRLIAGPFSSAAEASQACALFKKAARPCEATVYAGDAL